MNKKGYTLLEISVVIVLIGVILLLAIPRVQDTLTGDRMRSAVRNLSGTARDLKASAVREQVDHYLHLDLDQRRVWNTRDDMTAENRTLRRSQARPLPSGVRIADVALADEGKKNQGEVIIRFFTNHPKRLNHEQFAIVKMRVTDSRHNSTNYFTQDHAYPVTPLRRITSSSSFGLTAS